MLKKVRSVHFKPFNKILSLVVVTICCAPSLLSSQSPITPQLNARHAVSCETHGLGLILIFSSISR